MEICQYEFQFQNEFMGFLEEKIGKLLDIPINQESMIRKDIELQSFILHKKNSRNFMLFSANKTSYVYLLIIRCEKQYEKSLREILFTVCEEIEEEYNEDHRKEVKDVFKEKGTRFDKLEEKYQLLKLLDL